MKTIGKDEFKISKLGIPKYSKDCFYETEGSDTDRRSVAKLFISALKQFLKFKLVRLN